MILQEENDGDVADLLDDLNRSSLTRDSWWDLSSSDHGSSSVRTSDTVMEALVMTPGSVAEAVIRFTIASIHRTCFFFSLAP